MIDNFEVLERFINFKQGTFYKFELLVRNTDGENDLYYEGISETNKNILVKSWFVDNEAYYKRIKKEMIELSNATGARIYVTLDRKDNVKLLQNLALECTQKLVEITEGKEIGIKTLSRMFASKTSVVETSDKSSKTIMFDVDANKPIIRQAVEAYIVSNGITPYTFESRQGYHIFCLRKFDVSKWQFYVSNYLLKAVKEKIGEEHEQEIQDVVDTFMRRIDMQPNQLGLVYHPKATHTDSDSLMLEARRNKLSE